MFRYKYNFWLSLFVPHKLKLKVAAIIIYI